MRKSLALVLAPLLLAGCATVPREDQPDWYYKADDGTGPENGPMALWSLPSTMAFHVLRCNARQQLLEFEDIEAEEFEGGRPIRFEAGGQAWSGEERMEPPDGVPVSSVGIPLDHPVVTALGRGEPLRITGAFGSFVLDSPRPVRRVVRECREAARP